MPATIYYHADCLDGFGAAWAAWSRFGETARYRPLHHGDEWLDEEVAGRDVYILDFSFPPAELQRMATRARQVTLLDHHVTARNDWHALLRSTDGQREIFEQPSPALEVVFVQQQSGATLAWQHFHPQQSIPLLLQHIEDIDLWRFALPGTRAFCRALRQEPFEFARWQQIASDCTSSGSPAYRRFIERGTAIEDFIAGETQRLASGSLSLPARLRGEPVDALQAIRHDQPTISDGTLHWLVAPALAVNAPALFASELGHLLAERAGGIGLTWQLAPGGLTKVSLRSVNGVDVGEIATRYGGGGHRAAAGFRLPVKDFLGEILGLG